MGKIGISCVV